MKTLTFDLKLSIVFGSDKSFFFVALFKFMLP